jgi:hypothetical protein
VIVTKGEVREVAIEVINEHKDQFIIETANYEIINLLSSFQGLPTAVIETGVATIEGHTISTLFSASQFGNYNVIFTYRIGPEILIAKVYVEVK